MENPHWLSAPSSWHRALKTLVVSQVIGVSFVLMTRSELLDHSCMWAGHWKEQAMTRSLEYLALPYLIVQRGKKGWNGVKNPSCLPDEGSIEPQSTGFRKLPGWWTHEGAGRAVRPDRAQRLSPALPYSLSYALLSGCSSESFTVSLCNKLQSVSVFPEFYELLLQIIKLEEGVAGTSNL